MLDEFLLTTCDYRYTPVATEMEIPLMFDSGGRGEQDEILMNDIIIINDNTFKHDNITLNMTM